MTHRPLAPLSTHHAACMPGHRHQRQDHRHARREHRTTHRERNTRGVHRLSDDDDPRCAPSGGALLPCCPAALLPCCPAAAEGGAAAPLCPACQVWEGSSLRTLAQGRGRVSLAWGQGARPSRSIRTSGSSHPRARAHPPGAQACCKGPVAPRDKQPRHYRPRLRRRRLSRLRRLLLLRRRRRRPRRRRPRRRRRRRRPPRREGQQLQAD